MAVIQVSNHSRILPMAVALSVFVPWAQAQVDQYQFLQALGTYTEITEAEAAYSLGAPTYWPQADHSVAWTNDPAFGPEGQPTPHGWNSPAEGPGFPIGFDFEFNDETFDVIAVSNGEWISFGKSSDGNLATWAYNLDDSTSNWDPLLQADNLPEPAYKRNRVAAFGRTALQPVDWSTVTPPGPKSSLLSATIGEAPERICVVQWKDFGLAGDIVLNQYNINFQIRLHEGSNLVEMCYGPMSWGNLPGINRNIQVGLGGSDPNDFIARTAGADDPFSWEGSAPAPTADSYMGSGYIPEGLAWVWIPSGGFGMGIGEHADHRTTTYPNPGNGTFHIDVPPEMGADSRLMVIDAGGRIGEEQFLATTGRIGMDLGQLPNGLYNIIVQNDRKRLKSRLNIIH